MSKFSFDPKICIRCGVCIQSCPKGLLMMESNGPVMPEERSRLCNNCGQCVAFCPTGAARQTYNEGHVLEESLPFDPSLTQNRLRFLKSRRSTRSYLQGPMPREELRQVLDTANYAPSGGNNRTLRWIVLESKESVDQLRQLIIDWFDRDCRQHPVYSKRYNIDSILQRCAQGKDVIFRGAPHVAYCVGPSKAVWGPVDTGIALTYFNLACEAFNAGCCFAGYATKAAEFPEVRRFLDMKEEETAWCAVCFGKKFLQPRRIPYRGEVPVSFL